MTELRFHRDLYLGTAIDEAVKVFERHGQFSRAEEPSYWVVKIEGRTPARERQLSGEISNYALGLTIKQSGEAA